MQRPDHASDATSHTNPNGNTGRVASTEQPTPEATVADTVTATPADDRPAEHKFAPEEIVGVEEIYGKDTTEAMCAMYNRIVTHPQKKARDFGALQSSPIEDKQDRTKAHILVRNVFFGVLDTTTESDNCITIKASGIKSAGRNPNAAKNAPKGRARVSWDERGGDHLHFTLYKENKDTMEVLSFINARLKLPTKNLQMSGTKDRRGVTVQRISAFRVQHERLQGLNQSLKAARIGDYSYQRHGLHMGDLAGNEFLLTLRNCRFDGDNDMSFEDRVQRLTAIAQQSVNDLRDRGYINYYGLQRFGAHAVGTHDVGRLMLQGDLKGAVDAILSYTQSTLDAAQSSEASKVPADDKARAEALHDWKTKRSAAGVHDKLPRRFQAEHSVIRHLSGMAKKAGQAVSEDWQGALMSITRNLRLMYVHAYQSLVFNCAAAKRLQTYGHKVVEGDLVVVQKVAPAPEEDVDEDGEVIIRPAPEDSAKADDDFERARPLSKTEAESGSYTLADVVLPLPGWDVVYPSNAIGDYYRGLMGRDQLDPHNMRRSWREISLSGGYRKLMSRPLQVSAETRTYAADDQQLVQTDLEKLIAAAKGLSTAAKADDGQHDKIAIVLKMQLGSSQYATMALRELTKGGALSYKPDFHGDR